MMLRSGAGISAFLGAIPQTWQLPIAAKHNSLAQKTAAKHKKELRSAEDEVLHSGNLLTDTPQDTNFLKH